MDPSPPLLVCVFLFFLSSTLLINSVFAFEDETYSDCAPFPFKCGSITNITYPFLADGRRAACGHPSFYLTCENENDSPVISVSSMPFVVRDINYNTRALTLVSKDIIDADCPIPYKSPSLDTSTFLYATEDQYVNVYFKCSANLTDPDFREIPCLRDIDVEGRPGYYTLPSSPDPPSWFGKCNASTIDVLDVGLKRLQQKNSSSTFGNVVNEGFRLTWDAGDRWCNECIESGGRCGYNAEPGEISCLCPDEAHWGTCKGRSLTDRSAASGVVLINHDLKIIVFCLIWIVNLFVML
ncbi:hypothetical protein H6P81_010473 [Aristolochia fimbriata]|uniref:Uncharacterized protein n=1 Tax=Aristolochia fimbriata TaxID=158543 RepID=A0AAV7EP34_ARIFI|nr:hypothetical protein H6P81_010473 [Aristolochia fimbriata]